MKNMNLKSAPLVLALLGAGIVAPVVANRPAPSFEEGMRALCLAQGLVWKEPDVTYVGVDCKPQCFAPEWPTITPGGPH